MLENDGQMMLLTPCYLVTLFVMFLLMVVSSLKSLGQVKIRGHHRKHLSYILMGKKKNEEIKKIKKHSWYTYE